MKFINCPICGATTKKTAKAVISPWIRALGVTGRLSNYMYCGSCDFGFFGKRYSTEEMSSIYRGYRGPEYLRTRMTWEPWYSQDYNGKHDSKGYIEMRVKSLDSFLSSNQELKIGSILDVGGDRGQYIPSYKNTRKFVLEVSDKAPVEDVTRIASLEDLPYVDLIIYAHVLEHVAFPVKELQGLLKKTNHVYVEVPYGIPVITTKRTSVLNLIVHIISSQHPKLWKSRTAPATMRSSQSELPLTQSEHINFFSEKSMEAISKQLNTECTVEVNRVFTPDNQVAQVIQCLFTVLQK